MRRGRRNWLKITGIGCIGLPLLVILISFGIFKYQFNRVVGKLPEHVAALRKMGVPVEPEDLVPDPPIPAEQNAGPLLIGIIRDLKKERAKPYFYTGSLRLHELSDKPGSRIETEPAIVGMFAKLEPLFRRLDSVSNYSGLYIPPESAPTISGQLQNSLEFHKLIELQRHRSYLAVVAGDPKKSLVVIQTLLAMVHLLNANISQMASETNIHGLAYRSLKTHLAKFQDNQPVLEATRKVLEAFPETIDARRSQFCGIVLDRERIRKMISIGELNPENPRVKSSLLDHALEYEDFKAVYESMYLGQWRRVFERMGQDGRDWKSVYEAGLLLERELAGPESSTNVVNKRLFGRLHLSGLSAGLLQARNRLALLAVRLLQDRPTGLPESLHGYGEIAIDPMSGKPMRYKRQGRGFKIWSVGTDLVDNGGNVHPSGASHKPGYDEAISFSYPEPPSIPRIALPKTP